MRREGQLCRKVTKFYKKVAHDISKAWSFRLKVRFLEGNREKRTYYMLLILFFIIMLYL